MSSPYILPDGNVLLSISGGRTSGFMLSEIKRCNPNWGDRVKVVFANTGKEMPETLDFVRDMQENWGIDFIWLEYVRIDGKVSYRQVDHTTASSLGEPFEALISFKGYAPNAISRFCTQELKVRTIKRYLVAQGWKKWTQAIGIRADEAGRLRTSPPKDRWTNWYPLANAQITKRDVMDFWEKQPFQLGLYGPTGSTPKGNCDGCFLKSEATLAMMWREHPDRMQWWADMETKVSGTFHKNRSYAGLGEFVSRQSDWIFNDEDFLCQATGGECTG